MSTIIRGILKFLGIFVILGMLFSTFLVFKYLEYYELKGYNWIYKRYNLENNSIICNKYDCFIVSNKSVEDLIKEGRTLK